MSIYTPDLVSVDVSVDYDGLTDKLNELEAHDHDGTYAEETHTHDEYVTEDRLDEVVSEKIHDTMIEGYTSRTDFNDLRGEFTQKVYDLESRIQDLERERGKDGHVIDLLRQLVEAVLRRA